MLEEHKNRYYSKVQVHRLLALILFAILLTTTILWKVEADEDHNTDTTIAGQKEAIDALRKRNQLLKSHKQSVEDELAKWKQQCYLNTGKWIKAEDELKKIKAYQIPAIKRQKKELKEDLDKMWEEWYGEEYPSRGKERSGLQKSDNVGTGGARKYIGEFTATAYCPGACCCGKYANGRTATGLPARHGVIAVDPRVIKLGTKLKIEGYGQATAADTGGKIKGRKIDLCFKSHQEALNWGKRTVKVWVIK